MVVISKQDILQKIVDDWGHTPQAEICTEIFKFLLRIELSQATHITYGSLRQVANTRANDQKMMGAIQYLCGDRIPLLEAKFELIDDDGEFDLTNSDVSDARSSGGLIHPETGELVTDIEEKIFMYFRPGVLVKELRAIDVN
jgi:hypothetical protein